MANIDTYIEQIRVAEYGEEVRGSIINALVAENNESTTAYDAAIASQTSAQASAAAAETFAGNASESARVAGEVGTNSVKAINDAVSAAITTLDGYDSSAKTSAEAAARSASNASDSEIRAKSSEEAAANSALAAAGSANAASTSAATARDAEANAKTSEVEAAKSKEAAAKSAESAKSNADSAITSINTVLNIQTAVDKSAKDAADSAKAAEDAAQAAIGIAKIDFAKATKAGLAKPDNTTIKVIDDYGTLSAPGIQEHIDDDVMYDRSDNPDGVHNIRIFNSQTGKRTLQHYDGATWTDQFTNIKMPDDGTITMDDDGTIHGASTFELPTASADTKGGVKIGDGLKMKEEVLSVPIDDALDKDSTNPVQNKVITTELQHKTNPNLLDNPWFTVNQRSKERYVTSAAYAVDRWFIQGFAGNTVTLVRNSDNSITITSSAAVYVPGWRIYQIVKNLNKDEKVTLTIEVTSLTNYVEVFIGNESNWMRLGSINVAGIHTFYGESLDTLSGNISVMLQNSTPNNNTTIKRIKFEYGDKSTFVYDTEPNYGDEVVKCITSSADPNDTYANQTVGSNIVSDAWNGYGVEGNYYISDNTLWHCKVANSNRPSESDSANWRKTSVAKELPITEHFVINLDDHSSGEWHRVIAKSKVKEFIGMHPVTYNVLIDTVLGWEWENWYGLRAYNLDKVIMTTGIIEVSVTYIPN